jgi:hypothetical protein
VIAAVILDLRIAVSASTQQTYALRLSEGNSPISFKAMPRRVGAISATSKSENLAPRFAVTLRVLMIRKQIGRAKTQAALASDALLQYHLHISEIAS